MSEPIPAEISIGGKIRPEIVPDLCEAISDEGVSLEWGDAYFKPKTGEELLDACQDKAGVRVLWLCNDQANYGLLDVLEEFLAREQISFRHKSDAKYEFDAMIIEHRPQIGQVCYASDSSGQPLIPLSKLARLVAAVDEAASTAEAQTAFELRRRLGNIQQLVHESLPIVVPPLEPFAIGKARIKRETVSG